MTDVSTVVPGAGLARFLAAYPPFDRLDEETRAALAAAARVDAYATGELVLDAFATASVDVHVVVSGRVELWDDRARLGGAPDEVMGPGGLFGFSAMLTERSIGPRAVAAVPSTVARIPETAALPVFTSRQGARYLAERLAAIPVRAEIGPTYSTVDELVRSAPLVVGPDASVAEVARSMTTEGVPYAVVDLGGHTYGLVTDSVLRQRVLVEGVPGSAPIREVMTSSPPTVVSGSSAAEALIHLFDREGEFLLVTDPGGALRGVVAPRDFAVSPTTAGVSLHEQLRRAATTDELVDRAHRTPGVLEDLLARGLGTGRVIAVYSSILDTLVRRAIGLIFAEHPELDVDAFTWLSLGSNGRREAVLSSDVDCAVAFDDRVPEADIPAYRAVFAEVEDVLSRSGVRGDRHGATASHPTFARTNTQWRAAAEEWLAAPVADNGAMMTSLLVDGRPIHGDPGLPAVTEVFGDLRRHPGTMRLLLEESLASRARMRSWRDVLSGRPETFYIKAHAVLPVVNLARWAALAVGSSALPTVERLRAASGSQMLPGDRAETLVEVFGLLQRLRLRYQLLQRQSGDRPSDLLTLDRLSSIDRSLVAEAVREIAAIQRRMTNVAHFVPAEGWVAADRPESYGRGMTVTDDEVALSDEDLRRTLRDVRRVARLLMQGLEPDDDGPNLLQVLEEHLGVQPDTLAVTSEDIPLHRTVDSDIAITEIAERDPEARLLGLGGGDMRHHMTFGDQIQHARYGNGGALGQVEYVQTAIGPGPSDHRNVVASGMWLFRYGDHPVAVRMQGAAMQMGGRPFGRLDVLAVDSEVARELVTEVRRLMQERSILRGQVVTFADDPYGQGLGGITFFERPAMVRDDVVLPDGLLERVADHVLGIAEHRAVLAEHGQHLKRGILLFGPPGTGKTHTVRYLMSQSLGTTVVLLSGGSLRFIHDAAKVARAHQPAIVVLEDCDLIAEDRSFGPMAKPLLFEVLDALDGIDADADVAFLLTTNRVEHLERALSQRPGRVDLAAEIPLPDEQGRRALIRLYAGALFSDDAVQDVARGSEGTTASFAKELVRRAVLLAAASATDPEDAHLLAALDALQSDNEALTRSLLGSGSGPEPGFGPGMQPGPFPSFGSGGF